MKKLLGLAVCVCAAALQASTWTGGGVNNSWQNASNWDNGVPGFGNPEAVFNSDAEVTLDADVATLQLTVNNGAKVSLSGERTVSLSDAISLAGATVELTGGVTLSFSKADADKIPSEIILGGATLQGFGNASFYTATLPALTCVAGTTNTILNSSAPDWRSGATVNLAGALTGAGVLKLVSRDYGFYLSGDFSAFAGTLIFDLEGEHAENVITTPDLSRARVRIDKAGTNALRFANVPAATTFRFGALDLPSDASLTLQDCGSGHEWSGWAHVAELLSLETGSAGDSRIAGSFREKTDGRANFALVQNGPETRLALADGFAIQVNGRCVKVSSGMLRVETTLSYLDAEGKSVWYPVEMAAGTTLSGTGRLGELQQGGNDIFIANAPGETLHISTRKFGSSGRLVAKVLVKLGNYQLVNFPYGTFNANDFALDDTISDFKMSFIYPSDGSWTFCVGRLYFVLIVR